MHNAKELAQAHPLRRVQIETKAAASGGREPAADPVAGIVATLDAQGREIKAIADRQRAADVKAKVELVQKSTQAKLQELRDLNDRGAKARGGQDPLDREQLARINAAIDSDETAEIKRLRAENRQLRIKAARPGLPARNPEDRKSEVVEMARQAAIHYLRTGDKQFKGRALRDWETAAFGPEAKSMHSGSAPDGGFFVQPERDGSIEKLLAEYVPLRRHASVKTITSKSYEKAVRTSTGGASWGTELVASGETNTPKYSLLDYPAHNLYAEPRVSADLVEDGSIDIVGEINDGALEDFALAEAVAFISGDGVKKPFGILGLSAADYVANASWAWGKIGYRATGASGAFPTSSGSTGSADPILAMEFDLKQAYRQNAKWMMNRASIGACRLLKDGNGQYVWVNGNIIQGVPATLNGREVIEAEQMPDIAANSFSIALADWERAYVIVDRVGMTVLRDEYTAYPMIAFKTRKRVGGGLMNFDAIKLLKFST